MALINARRLDTSPIPQVVDHMFPLVGSGFAHGPSGAGKSYAFLTKLALDVANGAPFFGHDTIQGTVIVALGEGLQDAGIRIAAQLAQHAEDDAALVAAVREQQGDEAAEQFAASLPPYTDDLLVIEDGPFDMPFGPDGKPSVSMQQFIAAVAPVQPTLIIYDALADFASGSITNDYAANQYVKGIKHLVKRLDCFVLGIAHDTEKGDKMLGAGRFKNAADIMIGIKPESGDEPVSTVISEKAKYGSKFGPFSYQAMPKIWDEPVLDDDGQPTGETERVETNVVVLRDDAGEDAAFVMPDPANRTLPATLALPMMRNAAPPKRKRTGVRPAASLQHNDPLTEPDPDPLAEPCLECGAATTGGCNPLPGSSYITIRPGVYAHTSRGSAVRQPVLVS